MYQLLLLNGPNLNLLGTREPERYGTTTLHEIERQFIDQVSGAGCRAECFQSNHEGALIDRIHDARAAGIDAIVINPGAYGHSSIALRDALLAYAQPFVEVHLSNIHARESFRHKSMLADIAAAVICGMGARGYRYATDYALDLLQAKKGGSSGVP